MLYASPEVPRASNSESRALARSLQGYYFLGVFLKKFPRFCCCCCCCFIFSFSFRFLCNQFNEEDFSEALFRPGLGCIYRPRAYCQKKKKGNRMLEEENRFTHYTQQHGRARVALSLSFLRLRLPIIGVFPQLAFLNTFVCYFCLVCLVFSAGGELCAEPSAFILMVISWFSTKRDLGCDFFFF